MKQHQITSKLKINIITRLSVSNYVLLYWLILRVTLLDFEAFKKMLIASERNNLVSLSLSRSTEIIFSIKCLYWKSKSNENWVQNIVDTVAFQVNFLYLSESWQFKAVGFLKFVLLLKTLNILLSPIRNSACMIKERMENIQFFLWHTLYI